MLYKVLLVIHVSACLLLILTVLLQTGRGAGLNVFGGGGGGDSLIQSPSGSSFMKNLTACIAGTFAFTSLFLTLLSSRSSLTSVTSRVAAEPVPVSAPAVPAGPASPVESK